MSTLFTIITKDKPNSVALRLEIRPQHLDYLKGLGDQLVLAGPFMNAEGAPNGTLLIVKAADIAEAERLANGDPYVGAGLFSSSEISLWKWTVNAPEGI